MPEFEVSLFDGSRVASRRVTALDVSGVAAALGVAPAALLAVRPVGQVGATKPWAPLGFGAARFPLRLFSRELAVLLGAGIPLLEALGTLREKEAGASVSDALGVVIERVREGQSFSTALASRPAAFDPLFVAVVSSAERTGQLREALQAHAAYLAWVEELRARLIAAAVYPAMLVAAGFSVMLFLLVYVVPRFAGLLDGVGGQLPAASEALITIGRSTGAHPWATVAAGLIIAVLPFVAARVPALRAVATEALWSLPALGAKLRLLALARLYRTASMLLDAGVPLVAALHTAQGVVSPRLRAALGDATEAVSRGERLSSALEAAGLVTPVSRQMIRVGERSGALGAMLGQAAAFYDEELSRLSDLVTRLVNPLLMLLMGGLIGGVIVLMYLPIFQLVEQVG